MNKTYTYPLFRRSLNDLQSVCKWAQNRGDDPYALGVMAALSYAFCKCKKTPEELVNDIVTIKKAAKQVGWAST